MTYTVEQRGETQRLNEELARIQRCRVLAAWAENKAAEKARRDALAAHWLTDTWTREEQENG
jgi:hypothetical protein